MIHTYVWVRMFGCKFLGRTTLERKKIYIYIYMTILNGQKSHGYINCQFFYRFHTVH